MDPTGELRGDAVHVGGDARQRFHDTRGYGRPLSGNEIALSRIEAAQLLFRGDLSGITLLDGTTVGFERFFVDCAAAADRFTLRYLVYSDLRDRGFYLSPVRDDWPGGAAPVSDDIDLDAIDLVAYERGSTPDTGAVAFPVQVIGERTPILASEVAGRTLAVVDEESDITYFAAERADPVGSTTYTPPPQLTGVLLDDRVIVWDAPPDLYERGFYGQPLTGRAADVEGAIQLSLVEAASLASDGSLELSTAVDRPSSGPNDSDQAIDWSDLSAADAIRRRGQAVEGDRFDDRLLVYERLRDRSMVPKTGFKFGADFRTYLDVETVSDLPHSEHLIRVIDTDHAFAPRELSLDVRLAGGVRKTLVFAMPVTDEIEWLTVHRTTP